MAKRTCYKLFKNLRKYIHCVFLGSSARQTNKKKPNPVVTSCRSSL